MAIFSSCDNTGTRPALICSSFLPEHAMQTRSYESCAAREIREETGMAAGLLEKVGEFYLAPGYSTEFMAVFIARELRPSPLTPDPDEFLQLERIPLEKALKMAEQGQLLDAKSLAALFVARPHLTLHL